MIVEVDHAYCQLLGRAREDLLSRNPLQVSFERARDSRRADPLTLFTYAVDDPVTGQPVERHWSLIAAPLLDAEGATSLVIQRVEDVSDYVRSSRAAGLTDLTGAGAPGEDGSWRARAARVEAELYARVQDLQHARAAEKDAADRLAALARVATAVAGAESVEALTTTVTDQGLAATGCDSGAIAVFSDDPAWLDLTITAGFGATTQRDDARLPADGPLPACVAAATGRSVLLRDAEACLSFAPQMADVMAATGHVAFASIPLQVGGRRLGSLTAGWRHAQPFDGDRVALLEAFAAQCAQALQRLGARDAERAAAQATQRSAAQQASLVAIAQALSRADTEGAVLGVVARQGDALLDSNGSGLCLLEPDGAHVRTVVTDSYADVRTQVQLAPADFPLPAIRSAATGAAHFLPDRATTAARFPGSEDIYAAAGVQASAAVPLRAGGRLLGCLSVGFAEPRTWTLAEQNLLEAFAGLTAQALQRISALEAERAASAEVARFSETLQRSLLTAPPQPDHLQLVVRYTPAAAQAQVGGDWYDAFTTSDGSTSLVIGDVTGHDQRAAAVMAQMRNLLRGIGYTVGDPPAAVLSALDRAVHALGVDGIATVLLAQVEQGPEHRAAGTRLLRWSNAGHPPPLLTTPGQVPRYLDTAPDLLVGVDADASRTDHEVVLDPGATVLLYTDGLVERRGAPLQDGLDWLAQTVAASQHLPVDQLCDELLAQVAGHVEDDVALLAVRAHPEDRPRPAEAGASSDLRQQHTADSGPPL